MAVHAADGTRIAFDQVGEGPPLVIVQGAFTDRETPQSLAARLAERFTVFSYDRRGRGKSTDTFPYAVEREIEDLEAIIEVAGGSAFVYGQASGAILALNAAAHGSPITRLVAYEPPFVGEGSPARHAKNLVSRLEEMVAFAQRDAAVELYLAEALGLSAEEVASIKAGPRFQRMRYLALTTPYDAVLTTNEAMQPGVMAKVSVPTLLVAGGASPEWAGKAIGSLAREIPHAETLIIDGQGPDVSDDAIAPVLEKFFA
jgi:pimeloyl-ACP methyl ester carboxylesterase